MSLTSATPGSLISTTLYLPQPAVNPVKWVIKDERGNIVVRGQASAAGTTVIVSVVLPSSCKIPPDGSKYSISASDGITSAIEYFSVVSKHEIETEHVTEITYLHGTTFRDSLIVSREAECISVSITLTDGTIIIPSTPIDDSCVERRGNAFIYRFNAAEVDVLSNTTPPGRIHTHAETSFGTGTVVWQYTPCDSLDVCQEIHTFYTITPFSTQFINGIRKMVDKARIGDVNKYLEYTTSDLCHALMRGAQYCMQSPPVASGWPLNLLPLSLMDYIVKAGAVDILRAQYEAEGMSQFSMEGLGVQLNVDRTQYLAELIGQLNSDLEKLPAAKNDWLAQGGPLGAQMPGGKRPIGVLGLTRGTYSPWPMVPLPVMTGGYQFLGGGWGYGPMGY